MKKILILIAGVLLFMFCLGSSFAYDFEEDDIFGNDGNEFDVFDPDDEITNGSMYMRGLRLDSDIFQIKISAKEMTTPVLGIAFHLLYEDEKLAFLKYEPGEFLERGGDPFYMVTADPTLNKIIIGETLRRNDSFPLGDGVVATLYFQILEDEPFDFKFENGVISTLDVVRQDIDKIAWEDFLFVKNDDIKTLTDVSKVSSFHLGNFNISSIWGIIAMFIVAIPVSYFVISLIKDHSKFKKKSQIG